MTKKGAQTSASTKVSVLTNMKEPITLISLEKSVKIVAWEKDF